MNAVVADLKTENNATSNTVLPSALKSLGCYRKERYSTTASYPPIAAMISLTAQLNGIISA